MNSANSDLNKFLKFRRFGFFIMIMALGLMGTPGAGLSAVGSPKVVGYFVEWGVYGRDFHVTDIPAEKLTHVNYAFAKIENGEVAIWDPYAALEKFYPETDSWNDPSGTIRGNFNQLRILKEKNPHLKVLISVGGWTGSAPFSDMASTEEGRKRFARSALEFVQTYGFDGVDIDWEYPVCSGLQAGRPEDGPNFTLLLRELRETLGPDYLLTFAAGANSSCIEALEWDQIEPLIDWVNLMTYDFHGAWEANWGLTGHHAPLFDHQDPVSSEFNMAATVDVFISTGLPREKIVPGVAFYGRSASGVQGSDGLYAPFTGAGPGSFEPGMLDYKDIVANYTEANGYARYWDDAAQAPYIFNAQKQEFITYDDQDSVRAKASYATDRGLGGIMFWELSGDNGDLLQAIHDGFGASEPVDACSDGLDNDGDGLVDFPADPGCSRSNDNNEYDEIAPPPPPPSGEEISTSITITNDWGTGYCAEVGVTNIGQAAAEWTAEFEVDGVIGSFWGGSHTQTGQHVIATGMPWNAILDPGRSAVLGLCADRLAPPPPPPPVKVCSDGLDNDGDGLIDFPADPGCADANDEDESNQVDPPPGENDLETVTVISSDWGSGYCADVKVTSHLAVPVDWEVYLEVDGEISSFWNGIFEQNGLYVTVSGKNWNRTIQPGQNVGFGYCAAR